MDFDTINYLELDETESTNLYFKNNPETSYDIVSAHFQSKGKGQANNSWYSSKSKNALFSMKFKQKIPISHYFDINKAVSIGVYEAIFKLLKEHHIDTQPLKIKWPNDIYYHNKKLGGILIENAMMGTFIEKQIIGIGFNILETEFPDTIPNPTSLKILFPHINWDVLTIIKWIYNNVYREIQKLKPPFNYNDTERYVHILYQYGVIQPFLYSDKKAHGIIKGVHQNGQLLVEFEDGETKAFNQKEIVFL
jgi:BirA family biotin operon repressor/biotin-[acetyl-CoA-carboxylase] ligase